MEIDAVLSLLGLALRGGRLVMGEEPVETVTQARDLPSRRVGIPSSTSSPSCPRRNTRLESVMVV